MSENKKVVMRLRIEVQYEEGGPWTVLAESFPVYEGELWFMNERMGKLLDKGEERGEIFEMRTSKVD